LSRYHGKNVGYLENEMFTLGNLVNKLTYNEKTQKFKVKLIYKYEGYGFLNKSAVDSATFTLDKKDIEYFGMLEENYKGNDFPSKKRTFYDYDKFHGFAKGLDGTNILKLFKPKESSYGDGNLKDVIVLKISDDAYHNQSCFPGVALIPQKYSRMDYENLAKYLPGFEMEE